MDKNERVGRRLFGVEPLAGATDQKVPEDFFDPRHFLEKRGNGEVSLDRLGRSNVEPKVANWLMPRAKAAGESMQDKPTFDGWAVISVRHLLESQKTGPLPVVASPEKVSEPDHPLHNPYHAHVCRIAEPDNFSPGFMTALTLKYLFETHKSVWPERVEVTSPSPSVSSLNWVERTIAWVRSLFGFS